MKSVNNSTEVVNKYFSGLAADTMYNHSRRSLTHLLNPQTLLAFLIPDITRIYR